MTEVRGRIETRSRESDRMQAMTVSERGTLLIADIGGYTHYLAGVELDHATDILADLIEVLAGGLRGQFRLNKIEGDAVFTNAPEGSLDAVALVAALEASYFAFADRRAAIGRANACPCKACSRVETLELKFVVHHGEYAQQRVVGAVELVGPDVIVAHRLLKNSVTPRTGIAGYALLTEPCIEQFGLEPERLGARAHVERTEEVGEVSGAVLDLESRWREERERRVVYVGAEDADVGVWSFETSAPPPVIWECMTSIKKQRLWLLDREDTTHPRGVPGVGSVAHCGATGVKFTNEILDWKPYRYVSYRSTSAGCQFLCTDEIEPLGDGRWRCTHRIRAEKRGLRVRLLEALFGGRVRANTEAANRRLEGVVSDSKREAEAALALHSADDERVTP
jgi:class 3 adenylate cyclase